MVLTANAKIWNVSPTHCETEGDNANCNIFRTLKADYTFADGDTLLLAGGTYDESLTTNITKKMVMMAKEGEKPVIKMAGYYFISATAKFDGITFDHTDVATNSYCLYFADDVTAKYLEVDNCEFKGFTSFAIGSWQVYHIDSCIINNSYFHDLGYGAVYFAASSLENKVNYCDKLKVTNSTFANITLSGTGVLDLRNNGSAQKEATSRFEVDHCTFYNCKGYERILQSYKSPDVEVSNNIFMNPLAEAEEAAEYAVYMYGTNGVTKVHHNLNYQTKRQYANANSTGCDVTDSICRDPQFVDAAGGDFTLKATSPALKAGSDGSNLGDPRWWPAVISAVPTEAAPVPTWPADQVKSLYSDTYTFAPASLNSYNEGWWDQPTLTEEAIDGNKFLHYNGRMTGMIGWQFGDISASIMEYIHVDIWPSANTTLKMGPTSPNPTVVASVEITVEAGKWNSIDIPVSALLTAKPELNLADIFQNQFTNYGALTDLSIDNVYFYRTTPYVDEAAPTAFTAALDAASYFGATIKAKATDESGAVAFTVKNGDAIVGTGAAASGVEAIIKVAGLKAGTKYNLSVIASDDSGNAAEAIAVEVTTTAGPAPAATPKTYKGLVKSLYSDAYTTAASVNYYQEWWKGAPISTGELADGENVIFYGVAEEGASFGWAFDPIDLTEYPFLHVSVYPLAAGTIEIYPVHIRWSPVNHHATILDGVRIHRFVVCWFYHFEKCG